jgi:hypothetical protein
MCPGGLRSTRAHEEISPYKIRQITFPPLLCGVSTYLPMFSFIRNYETRFWFRIRTRPRNMVLAGTLTLGSGNETDPEETRDRPRPDL